MHSRFLGRTRPEVNDPLQCDRCKRRWMFADELLSNLLLFRYVGQLSLLAILCKLARIPYGMRPAHIESRGLKTRSSFMVSEKEFFAKIIAQPGVAHHHAISGQPR